MESIVAAYGSSSEQSDVASVLSDSEVEDTETHESNVRDNTQVGLKRKRLDEVHWKRAFPHVDGNWPSHIRINISVNQELRELAEEAIERAQKLVGDAVTLVAFEELGHGRRSTADDNIELHLSLSRPFVLRYNQINAFVDSLRAALKWRQRFSITLGRALVLVNDDKTRSFLALRVVEGEHEFVKVLRCVDLCLAHLELPTYYKVRHILLLVDINKQDDHSIICVVVFAADGLGHAAFLLGWWSQLSTGSHSAC